MNKVLDICRYVINYSIKNNNPVSNLKLQKLLYYIQARALVQMDEPCFDEEILCWAYGPVVKEAYDEYKVYGRKNIEVYQEKVQEIKYDDVQKLIVCSEKKFDDSIINDNMKKLINTVLDSYREFEARDLVVKTHLELPWKNTSINNIIEKPKIKIYYKINQDKL